MQFFLSQLGERDIDFIDEQRRKYAALHDEMKSAQKTAGKDGGFFKEQARDAMKHYRAACLLLGQVAAHPPGDAGFVPLKNWPAEIVPFAARMAGAAICR